MSDDDERYDRAESHGLELIDQGEPMPWDDEFWRGVPSGTSASPAREEIHA